MAARGLHQHAAEVIAQGAPIRGRGAESGSIEINNMQLRTAPHYSSEKLPFFDGFKQNGKHIKQPNPVLCFPSQDADYCEYPMRHHLHSMMYVPPPKKSIRKIIKKKSLSFCFLCDKMEQLLESTSVVVIGIDAGFAKNTASQIPQRTTTNKDACAIGLGVFSYFML